MIRALLAIAVCCAPAQAIAEVIVQGPTRIAGDGRTAVVLKVSSERVTGGELSATTTAGVVRRTSKTAEGFELELVPPRVVEELDARISLTIRGGARTESKTHTVVFTPSEIAPGQQASGGPFDLRGPERLFLKEGVTATFSLSVEGRDRPPVVVASAGRLDEPAVTPDGRYTVRWSPPPEAYPQVLQLVALSSDNSEVDVLSVPLLGRGRVRLESEPRASVTVRVGEIEFGPVTTGSKGRAELAVAAPPGIDVANTVATDPLGNETLGTLRLGAPPFPRVFAACPPSADRLVVGAVDELGAPAPSADLVVRASSGALSAPRSLRPGLFEARLSSSTLAEDVELSAALRDRPDAVSRCRPPALPGLLDGDSGIAVSVRGGYLSNLGRIDGPVVYGDASYRFPLRGVSFSLGIHLGVVFGFDSSQSSGLDPETIRTQIVAVPVMAQFTIGVPLGKVTPYLSGGAGIALARGTISSRSADIKRSATRPAARGGIGVAVDLGPGAVVAEAAYLHARLDEPEISGRIGGVHVTAGYAWTF